MALNSEKAIRKFGERVLALGPRALLITRGEHGADSVAKEFAGRG